jgi:hypothetical protein
MTDKNIRKICTSCLADRKKASQALIKYGGIRIAVGDFVKLAFSIKEQPGHYEHMWVKVTHLNPLSGRLDNDPGYAKDKARGDNVDFVIEDVEEYLKGPQCA